MRPKSYALLRRLNRRNACPQFGDAVLRYLRRPIRVDGCVRRAGHRGNRPQIQFQVGYVKPFAVRAERGTCRKQQTVGHAVVDTVEVAEFGNGGTIYLNRAGAERR